VEALRSFKTSATNQPVTQHYIPGDLNLNTFSHNQLLATFMTECQSFITCKTFLCIGIFVIIHQIHRKLKMYTHQWQVGGTSFVSSSNDFSDLYSWTKATVTTIIIAWKEMVWLRQVHYTASRPLMVPTYGSQAQCQNQNKSCTAQCHIFDVHAPDKLTLPTTSFWLQKHKVLVTGSVSIISSFKCYH